MIDMPIHLNTLEDLKRRLRINPEYRKQERLLKPYFDLVLQIIRRRSELGLSQKDLAKKAESYQSRISKIESAEHDVRLSTLIRIAEALETEVVIKLVPFIDDREYFEDDYYTQVYEDCLNVISEKHSYDQSDQIDPQFLDLQTA